MWIAKELNEPLRNTIKEHNFEDSIACTEPTDYISENQPKTSNYFERVLNAILEGGKK